MTAEVQALMKKLDAGGPGGGVPIVLINWLFRSSRARRFCRRNARGIRRNLRNGGHPGAGFDTAVELHVGLLLNEHPQFAVAYEQAPGGGANFRVTTAARASVLVVARRLRERDPTVRYRSWRKRFLDCVRDVPGDILVRAEFQGGAGATQSRDPLRPGALEFVERLEQAERELHAWVRVRLRDRHRSLDHGEDSVEIPPMLAEDIVFTFSKEPRVSSDGKCAPGPWSEPILYVGPECETLGFRIADKIRQLVVGEQNVVAIVITGTTFDAPAALSALDDVRRRVWSMPDEACGRMKLDSVDELRKRWASLTAIVVIPGVGPPPMNESGLVPNAVWSNPDAGSLLAPSLLAHLESMRRP